jgi:hypothetical protein
MPSDTDISIVAISQIDCRKRRTIRTISCAENAPKAQLMQSTGKNGVSTKSVAQCAQD